MKKNKLILGTLLFLSSTCSYAQIEKPVYLDESQPMELRIKDALSRMTLVEKVKLCTAQSKFSSHGVPRLGIPELWMSDGPHGVRMEIMWDSWDHAGWTNDSCTAFPALTCLAATWNLKMSAIYGKAIGEEARYRGKNVLLGPGVNIYRTPLNGRNFEYLGEDPYLSSRMVIPYIQGVQSNGVAACVKHYALNDQEEERGTINVEVSDRALNEIYLPAFKSAIVEGKAWALMGSYNQYKGQHCCENAFLLNQVLKHDWGFDGCVITDWGGAHDTDEAALNGLDIEMGTGTNGLTFSKENAYDNYYLAENYLKKLQSGELPISTLNDKATRILRLIFRTAMNTNRPYGSLASPEHFEVARAIADEGIILLKNEHNLLPIDASHYRTIAVIGENAVRSLTVGGGSSELKVKEEVSPLSALIKKFGDDKIKYAKGYVSGIASYDKVYQPEEDVKVLADEAVRLASKADLVIFVGGLNKNHLQDCEGADRESYALPFGQNELLERILAVNHHVVAVMISGNAYQMPWIKQLPALVQTSYLGSEAGNAIVDVLSGTVNPSGKLPYTIATKLTDWGAHSFGTICYPGDGKNEVYKEDILVGYRWMDAKQIAPVFPFGYGLSYTTFKYGKASISNKIMTADGNLTVTVPVRNVGKIPGKEVVELYVNEAKCSVMRPEKELKGFQKIFLNPGETKTVTFSIDKSALQYYSESAKDWVAEKGQFTVLIGSSSRDIREKVKFELK